MKVIVGLVVTNPKLDQKGSGGERSRSILSIKYWSCRTMQRKIQYSNTACDINSEIGEFFNYWFPRSAPHRLAKWKGSQDEHKTCVYYISENVTDRWRRLRQRFSTGKPGTKTPVRHDVLLVADRENPGKKLPLGMTCCWWLTDSLTRKASTSWTTQGMITPLYILRKVVSTSNLTDIKNGVTMLSFTIAGYTCHECLSSWWSETSSCSSRLCRIRYKEQRIILNEHHF